MEDKEIYKSDKNNNLSVPIVKNDKSDKKYNSQIVYPIFLMVILLELLYYFLKKLLLK